MDTGITGLLVSTSGAFYVVYRTVAHNVYLIRKEESVNSSMHRRRAYVVEKVEECLNLRMQRNWM